MSGQLGARLDASTPKHYKPSLMDSELVRISEQLATTLGSAIALKGLLERLLGPSVDYAGKSIAALLERYGNVNLNDVFRRASLKLAAASAPAGYVNPRVLRAVIEDASYSTDEVAAEYFAGLLASSARGNGEDDRAMTFLSIVRSLTSAQLRLHHLTYSFLRVKYMGERLLLTQSEPARLFVADEVLTEHSIPVSASGRVEVVAGLAREALIERSFEVFKYLYLPRSSDGLAGVVLEGSPLGAQLFLWVHGQPELPPEDIFDIDLELRGWERLESRKVGTGGDIEAHTAARQAVNEALSLCETSPFAGFKNPTGLLAALKQLRTHARFLTPELYELVRNLPENPRTLEASPVFALLNDSALYLQGRHLR
jgi:hypothetical protein